MFNTLTEDERHELTKRLHHAGHKFAQVNITLASCSLAHHIRSRTAETLWHERNRFVAAMAEMHELAAASGQEA